MAAGALMIAAAGMRQLSGDSDDDDGGFTNGGLKSMSVQKLSLARDPSEPRDVYSWFEITLKEVNVPDQTFVCSIEVHVFWQDFNLPNVFPKYKEQDFAIDDDDLPIKMSEIFENKIGLSVDGDPSFEYIPETGTIYMMFVVDCIFVERMELQRFPLDRQFLNMEFNAWVKEGNWNWTLEPNLDWVPENYRNRKFAVRMVSSITEYELLGPWIDFTTDQPLSIRLRVNRKPGYYFGNIVFPNFLIVAGCFAAFVVPPSDVADRLSVTVTLMLAAVAFRFVVSTMLPKVAYLTIMDKYLLTGFIALITLIGENAVVGISSISNDTVKWIDYLFAVIFGGSWILIHIFATIAVILPSFYRITWEEMDEIDKEEDPDAEFVKAESQNIKTNKESDFCKQQWQRQRLKSPVSRAKLYELEHPAVAEKNKSQHEQEEEEQDEKVEEDKEAAKSTHVPSKVVGFKLDNETTNDKQPTKKVDESTLLQPSNTTLQSNIAEQISLSSNVSEDERQDKVLSSPETENEEEEQDNNNDDDEEPVIVDMEENGNGNGDDANNEEFAD